MGEKTPYENEGNLEKGEAFVFFKKKYVSLVLQDVYLREAT